MAMITLYARQQKRHRCIEQSFELCGRGRGRDDMGEWHWNMYIIICNVLYLVPSCFFSSIFALGPANDTATLPRTH